MGSLRRLSHVASVLAAVLTGCVVEERELCKDAFDPKSPACSLQYCEKHASEPDCVGFLNDLVDAGLIDRIDAGTAGTQDDGGRGMDASGEGDASGGEDADTPFKPSQCNKNADCKLLTSPVCEESTCTQCKNDGECAWRADAPACSDGACVPCNATNDKLCTDQGLLCKTGGSECVACNASADCKDPQNSVCNAESQCEPCQGHGDCEHLPNTPLCHQQQCVACLPGARDTCGNNVCDMVSQDVPVCAQNKAPRSATTCQPCVSDEQCQEGQLCVPQRWDGDGDNSKETLVGWFCHWKKISEGDSLRLCDSADRPYFGESTVTSADAAGAAAQTVCTLRVSTCSAFQSYSSPCGRGPDGVLVENRTRDAAGNVIQPPLNAEDIHADDSVCGFGGRCVARNATDGAYECSMLCANSNSNCPSESGVTCGGSPANTPGVCGIPLAP